MRQNTWLRAIIQILRCSDMVGCFCMAVQMCCFCRQCVPKQRPPDRRPATLCVTAMNRYELGALLLANPVANLKRSSSSSFLTSRKFALTSRHLRLGLLPTHSMYCTYVRVYRVYTRIWPNHHCIYAKTRAYTACVHCLQIACKLPVTLGSLAHFQVVLGKNRPDCG